MTSYNPQVKGIGEERFVGNGLYFATSAEALDYAKDLQSRWMGCKSGAENRRAHMTDHPVTHVWRNGAAHNIEQWSPPEPLWDIVSDNDGESDP
jgi:hypothetical protein